MLGASRRDRSGHSVQHRTDSRDEQTTGEVSLQSQPVDRRTVRHPCDVNRPRDSPLCPASVLARMPSREVPENFRGMSRRAQSQGLRDQCEQPRQVQTTEIIDPSRGFTRNMMYHSRVEAANLGLHRHELEEAIPRSGEGRSAAAGCEARAGEADPRWIFPYISDLSSTDLPAVRPPRSA
jgi:hypothetical protein